MGQLQKAIRDYLDQHNAEPKPFVWTKPADPILANEARALSQLRIIKGGNQALESEASGNPTGDGTHAMH